MKTTHLKAAVQEIARRKRKSSKDLAVQLTVIQDLTLTAWQPFIIYENCFEVTGNEIWNTGVLDAVPTGADSKTGVSNQIVYWGENIKKPCREPGK